VKSFVESKHAVVRGLMLALICCLILQSAPVGAQEGALSELEEDRLQEEQEVRQDTDTQAAGEQAAVQAFNATTWTVSDNLGVGTESPVGTVHILGREATTQTGSIVITEAANASQRLTLDANEINAATNLYLNPTTGADVGIGILPELPAGNLHIVGREATVDNGTLVLTRSDPADASQRLTLDANEINAATNLYLNPTTGADVRMVLGGGNVGIGTDNPSSKLHVDGTTTTGILQITGGSDLAEPFVIASAEAIEPGMVVAIDPEHPNQLRVADSPYDPMVAGIISGAGDIQPGLIMQQEELIQGETHPVALTGKVYVKAVGPIKIGDLLTSSDVSGHAMAATDRDLAFGTTIGKAMSALDEETGLVLVLVALQ
jgi:hypothetical protein